MNKIILFTLLTMFILSACENAPVQKTTQQQNDTLTSTPAVKATAPEPPVTTEAVPEQPAATEAVPEPPPEPYAFKKFKLGMTYAEFKKLKPHVYSAHKEKYEASGFMEATIGGEEASAFYSFDDYGKGLQLGCILMTIPKSGFSLVKEALVSKYGQPTNTLNITKSNAMGATFDGEKLVWDNKASRISAESIGESIDTSEINFYYSTHGISKKSQETSARVKKDI